MNNVHDAAGRREPGSLERRAVTYLAHIRIGLSAMQALLSASSVLERTVIVSSPIVFVLGLLTAWSLGFPLLGFLQGGSTNWLLTSVVLFVCAILLVPTVFIPKR